MPSRSSINLFVGGINKSLVVVLNLLLCSFSRSILMVSLSSRYDYYDPYFTNEEKTALSHMCVCVCVCVRAHAHTHVFSCSVMSNSLWPHGLLPDSFLSPWDFLGKHNGVGCQFLLQRIFPTRMEPKSSASPALVENGRWRAWTQIFTLSPGF